MKKSTYLYPVLFGLAAASMIVMPAIAKADCKVSVVLTIKGQPAMTAISSTITGNGETYRFKRHMYVQELTCGVTYTIAVGYNSVATSRKFTALKGVNTVAMEVGGGS